MNATEGRIMKSKAIIVVLCAVFALGCAAQQAAPPPPPPPPPPSDPCPLPSGFRLDAPTMQIAMDTLASCPDKLDAVFQALLSIGKNSPKKENRTAIVDLVKQMIDSGKVSERYAKSLLKRYFSTKFDSLPDTRVIRLSGEIESIKRNLRRELLQKREGMIECAGQKELYQKAERECVRIFQLMDYLVLNEEFSG